jgi:hypothetical protein
MSDCQPELVEAWCRGELAPAEALRLGAHIRACSTCAEEERWLLRERRLFAARAAVHPEPPSLATILEAARAKAPPRENEAAPALRRSSRRKGRGTVRSARSRIAWPLFGLAAAAAFMVFLCSPPREEPPLSADPIVPAVTPVPTAAGETCYACTPPTSAEDAPEVEGEDGCMSKPPVTMSSDWPQEE